MVVDPAGELSLVTGRQEDLEALKEGYFPDLVKGPEANLDQVIVEGNMVERRAVPNLKVAKPEGSRRRGCTAHHLMSSHSSGIVQRKLQE